MPRTKAETENDTAQADDAETQDDVPAWKGSLSSDEPIVAPDGHVVLSQDDIDDRA